MLIKFTTPHDQHWGIEVALLKELVARLKAPVIVPDVHQTRRLRTHWTMREGQQEPTANTNLQDVIQELEADGATEAWIVALFDYPHASVIKADLRNLYETGESHG